MLIPLSWLQDYIDLPDDLDTLREQLTFSGLEVEDVQTHGAEYENIVAAEITAVSPHPDADRLSLCTVDTGAQEPVTVVCGAPNARPGLKTIYASVGVTLPNGLKLKRAKIRGVESLGMLCAEDELGLSDAHEGILELPPDTAPGTPARHLFGGPEIVFDLEVTPNRPDCLSLIGVARELAALTGRKLRLPEIPLTENPENVAERISVHIDDPQACPRYTARLLTGASVGPSPDWMQKRLRLCGMRPVNNLVDITNYVMLETGQPLHAFDHTLLHGDAIHVRHAAPAEKMHTLDDQERSLSPDHLVIADRDRPVAVAGVMGGADSEIRPSTETVLLESASFESSTVRAAAKSLGIHTESSYRFARGCDPERVEWVSRRAASLMQQFAGATPLRDVVDAYPRKPDPVILSCTWSRITNLIGIPIPTEVMRTYFERLELEVLSADDDGCTLQIPSFRADLTREVDLVEEVARLNGLDNIPARAPVARIVPDAEDHLVRRHMRIWRRTAHAGFLEIMNYSLTAPETLEALDPAQTSRQVKLPNPISRDQSVLRTSLIPQMAETLARNHARQNHELALFELGTVFLQNDNSVEEQTRLTLGTLGTLHRTLLDKQRPVTDAEAFFDLKGRLEALLDAEGLSNPRFEPLQDPTFAPGQAASIHVGDQWLGRIGLLDAPLRERWKLHLPVALAEILLDALPSRDLPRMRPVPDTPSSSRDTALILDRSQSHAQIMDVIQNAAPKELERVELFDVFESEKLGRNRKSMAYRFTYRSPDKTLTDKAVEKFHHKIEQRLLAELNAKIVGRD